MKTEILELRAQGKSYREIEEILGCSKGTISYHCGPGQKVKYLLNSRRNKTKPINKLKFKVDNFLGRVRFSRINYIKRGTVHEAFCEKIRNNNICYLTGRIIDLDNSESYSLDHIVPYHISADNSIDNMAVVCKDANFSKSYLTVKQYLDLCKEVLEYNGYKVIKI